jgi:uncharacterized protein YdhG (YjbR/CyaY superfamily)
MQITINNPVGLIMTIYEVIKYIPEDAHPVHRRRLQELIAKIEKQDSNVKERVTNETAHHD